jgi:hypothetical protein
MKNFTQLILIALASAVFFAACKKHDDDHDHENEVTIEILEPAHNSTVDANDVHIHVRFTATESLEEIEVIVYEKENSTNIVLDIDMHLHQKTIDIVEDLDLSSFPAGTIFVLKAEAALEHHDDDDENHDHGGKVEKKIEFTIQ